MKSVLRAAIAVCAAWAAVSYLPPAPVPAHAQSLPWRCLTWDGPCEESDYTNPDNRQLLVVSTGFEDGESYWRAFENLVQRMTADSAGQAWSVQKKDRLLYVGYFTGGGPVGSASASFGARVIIDPGGAPTLDASIMDLYRFVDSLPATIPWLRPMGTAVLFAQGEDVTAAVPRSIPASFSARGYGVALVATGGGAERETYTFTHELAHASLNFVDEYVEDGLENLSIAALEVLAPSLVLDDSWGGGGTPQQRGWDLRLAEILAGNGPANLAPYRRVSTAPTTADVAQRFEYAGGLFFGRGTYHDIGSNLMNSNHVQRGPGDGFAYDHSPSQQQFIDASFGDAPYRANDRLRNAGPIDGWQVEGLEVELLLYDGDKSNTLHPTTEYHVQVGWFERGSRQWVTETHTIVPSVRSVTLPLVGRPEEELLLLVACRAGMTERSSDSAGTDVCDASAAFIPTLTFHVPYDRATVPVRQPATTYWWRFSTYNGSQRSGWTGWSSFFRSL